MATNSLEIYLSHKRWADGRARACIHKFMLVHARFRSRLFITCTHGEREATEANRSNTVRKTKRPDRNTVRGLVTGLILAWQYLLLNFTILIITFAELMCTWNVWECAAHAGVCTLFGTVQLINGPNFDLDFPQCEFDKFPKNKINRKINNSNSNDSNTSIK